MSARDQPHAPRGAHTQRPNAFCNGDLWRETAEGPHDDAPWITPPPASGAALRGLAFGRSSPPFFFFLPPLPLPPLAIWLRLSSSGATFLLALAQTDVQLRPDARRGSTECHVCEKKKNFSPSRNDAHVVGSEAPLVGGSVALSPPRFFSPSLLNCAWQRNFTRFSSPIRQFFFSPKRVSPGDHPRVGTRGRRHGRVAPLAYPERNIARARDSTFFSFPRAGSRHHDGGIHARELVRADGREPTELTSRPYRPAEPAVRDDPRRGARGLSRFRDARQRSKVARATSRRPTRRRGETRPLRSALSGDLFPSDQSPRQLILADTVVLSANFAGFANDAALRGISVRRA